MNYIEAMKTYKRIILEIDGRPPSSRSLERHKFDIFSEEAWLDGEKSDNPFNGSRQKAYLSAWLALSDSDVIPAIGVPAGPRDRISLDKGVVASLLKHEIIELQNQSFMVTQKGRDFLGTI